MCVHREESASMIQRNADNAIDSVEDERPGKEVDLGMAVSEDEIAGATHAGKTKGIAGKGLSGDGEDQSSHGMIDSIAPHKKLNTIKTKIEEEEDDDAKHLLSDEEMAWKLHQELNAGSPVLRTRLQRGGPKARSSLAEPSLRGSSSKGGKKPLDTEDGVDSNAKAGNKKRRVSRLGNVSDQEKRKSTRANASNQPVNDLPGVRKGKARSRKGTPHSAAEGADEQNTTAAAAAKAKKHTAGRRKSTKILPKIPKLPMVRQGMHWYRARVLKEDQYRILVEFAGYEHTLPSAWLPKYCERVWLGSYKGKDWRYHGDGAWVPKNGIQNRIINAEEYGISNEFVEERTEDAGRKTPVVGTPNLLSDASADDVLHKRRKKSNLSDKEANNRNNSQPSRKGRGRKRANSEENDSRTRQNSSKSVDDSTREDSEVGRRDRPKRHTKPTAILNSDDFAVDAEVDMMDSDLQNGFMDAADPTFVSHSKMVPRRETWNGERGRRYMFHGDPNNYLNSQDEQEALAALAEMPSSPVAFQGITHSEAMLEESREALLEAYTNGKNVSYDGRRPLRKQRKRSYGSEPDLHKSHTAESISVAEQMFGGLLHAVSARLGNGIHRSMSMPATTFSGASQFGWSPHVWSSGVTPADAEPAIIHVPKSLIQKALLSPKHMDANRTRPPVPLFY